MTVRPLLALMEEAAALAFLKYVLTPSIMTKDMNIARIERIRPVMAHPLERAFFLATPIIEKINPKVAKRLPTPGNQNRHRAMIPMIMPAMAIPLLRAAGTGEGIMTGCVGCA